MQIANLPAVAKTSHYTVLAPPRRGEIFKLSIINRRSCEMKVSTKDSHIRQTIEYLEKNIREVLADIEQVSLESSEKVPVSISWDKKEHDEELGCDLRLLLVTVDGVPGVSKGSRGYVRLLEFEELFIIVTNNAFLNDANPRPSLQLVIFDKSESYADVLSDMYERPEVQNVRMREMTRKERVAQDWITAFTGPLAGMEHELFGGWRRPS